MSSGTVHTKASLLLTGGFLFTAVWALDPSLIQYAVGSLIGVLITPDLDVDRGFSGDRYIRQRVGKPVAWVWDRVWHFYRRSLKHGGELSHFPIISTLGRIVYLYFLLIVVPHVVTYLIFSPQWDIRYVLGWYWEKLWVGWRVIFGLMGADTIHYFLDILTTNHKVK